MPDCWRFLTSANAVVNTSAHDRPCGSSNNASEIFPCCQPQDECMESGICHYKHSLTGGSGYYLGSCSDPTYQDPACPQNCGDQPIPDVVYNNTSSLWACCGADNSLQPHCQNPTDDTFSAPEPSKLAAFSSAPTSSTISFATALTTPLSSTTVASDSAQTTSFTGLPLPTSSSSNPTLSSGIIAGIAVACTVIGLLVLAGLGFLILRAKRQRRGPMNQPSQMDEHGAYGPASKVYGASVYNANGDSYYNEKHSTRPPYPLGHHFVSELPNEKTPGDRATGGAMRAELPMDATRAELSPVERTGDGGTGFVQELDGAEVGVPLALRTRNLPGSPSPRSATKSQSPKTPTSTVSPLSPTAELGRLDCA